MFSSSLNYSPSPCKRLSFLLFLHSSFSFLRLSLFHIIHPLLLFLLRHSPSLWPEIPGNPGKKFVVSLSSKYILRLLTRLLYFISMHRLCAVSCSRPPPFPCLLTRMAESSSHFSSLLLSILIPSRQYHGHERYLLVYIKSYYPRCFQFTAWVRIASCGTPGRVRSGKQSRGYRASTVCLHSNVV